MTSTDMMAVPLYAFILMELCRPGMVTVRMASAQLLPVIILPVLYIATGREIFYLIEVGYATVYGLAYAVWTIFAIRRYNILLHQQFSYEENINLNWLKVILGFFFMILSLWVLDCLHIDIDAESLYMLGSLVMWMFLAYFIYKHETVISGLKMISVPSVAPEEDSELALKIKDLFDSRQAILIRTSNWLTSRQWPARTVPMSASFSITSRRLPSSTSSMATEYATPWCC